MGDRKPGAHVASTPAGETIFRQSTNTVTVCKSVEKKRDSYSVWEADRAK